MDDSTHDVGDDVQTEVKADVKADVRTDVEGAPNAAAGAPERRVIEAPTRLTPARAGRMRLALAARWMLIVLTAVLGAVLVAAGHVAIGVLVSAMAALRAFVLVSVQRRVGAARAQRAARREAFRARVLARSDAPRARR